MRVVDRLGSLQFDPLGVAGRNHDLVLHARIAGYRREITDELLYGRRQLYETYNKSLNLLPTSELPYYRISWRTYGSGSAGPLLRDHAALAEKLMAEIATKGPMCSLDFEQEAVIDWWWGPTTAVRAVLEALSVTGRLGLARRHGNRRYYDLTERLFPAELLATTVPERDQLLHKTLSRFRGHGLLSFAGSGEVWLGIGEATLRRQLQRELVDRGEILAIGVEGLKSERYIVARELQLLERAQAEVAAGLSVEAGLQSGSLEPGCSFIAPLDPLMWDRSLLGPLYDFEYKWEVYTPAAKRRWGYYVLPVFYGDRFVGRIEPRIDAAAKSVRILSLAWERGFDPMAEPGFVVSLAACLRDYLAFAGATVMLPADEAGHRTLFRQLKRSAPTATD
jgi:uncharacterized protein YcaQ